MESGDLLREIQEESDLIGAEVGVDKGAFVVEGEGGYVLQGNDKRVSSVLGRHGRRRVVREGDIMRSGFAKRGNAGGRVLGPHDRVTLQRGRLPCRRC